MVWVQEKVRERVKERVMERVMERVKVMVKEKGLGNFPQINHLKSPG